MENKNDTFDIYRDPKYLIRTAAFYNKPAPLRILDAGTGISLLPEFAAYLGHHVVAIDISSIAIDESNSRTVSEQELIRCLRSSYNFRYNTDGTVDYLDRNTGKIVHTELELKKMFQPGGKILARVVSDWNDSQLSATFVTFDIILNLNGLRSASPELITKSLRSFYSLLRPGGILVVSSINAIMRMDEFDQLVSRSGFVPIHEYAVMHDRSLLKTEMNNTDKYIVLCWPTG
jgi:SAM-dependent methyltransferase